MGLITLFHALAFYTQKNYTCWKLYVELVQICLRNLRHDIFKCEMNPIVFCVPPGPKRIKIMVHFGKVLMVFLVAAKLEMPVVGP